ncbi:MAG TPA: HD domain-containing phosphohydrolase [Sphaerochaeta sp.]|nr:HD domain-containing phosphohydrolase [Sphaerochaeta sp.]
MVVDIIFNILLLLILSVVYSTYPFKNYKKLFSHTPFVGILLGVLGILIMLNPMVIEQGVQFDARSIIVGVSAMTFGFFPALIGATIMAIFRLTIQGKGTLTGIAVIYGSFVFGSIWRKFRFKKVSSRQHYLGLEFLLVGFVTHVSMYLCMFLLPEEIQVIVFRDLAVPILVYYPIGFYLLCLLLFNQAHRVSTINDLRKSERQFKTIFDQAPIGMSLTNLITGEIRNVNQSYLNFLGLEREGVVGKTWNTFTHLADKDQSAELTEKMRMGETGPFNLDKRFIRKDGTIVWGNLSLCVFEPSDEDPLESLCMTIDISERKGEEDRVRYASTHDALTGFYNRTHFEEQINNFSSEGRLPLAVAFGDVNGLRIINEAFGREQGNLLLQRIAAIIKDRLGKENYIARVGGDEVALIFFNTPIGEAERIIRGIREQVSEMLVMDSVRTSVSFGLCEMTKAEDDINEVIKRAEKDVDARKLMESPHMRGRAVYAIINTLHEKNKREELHSRRVSGFCEALAKSLEMSEWQVAEMKLLGLMHDIGKIAISESILNKEGKLTDKEWQEMKRHPEIGYRILFSVEDMAGLAGYVLAHHERFDGKGYPKGLKGFEIPLQSRIVAIADAFDAMTAERTYRKSVTPEDAAKELKKHAGTQFDPALARTFVEKFLNMDWETLS